MMFPIVMVSEEVAVLCGLPPSWKHTGKNQIIDSEDITYVIEYRQLKYSIELYKLFKACSG